MRPAVVVLGAIATIEIATIRDVKAALQRFTIEEALARFEDVVAGKFAADFIQKLHSMDCTESVYRLVTRGAIHQRKVSHSIARTRSARYRVP